MCSYHVDANLTDREEYSRYLCVNLARITNSNHITVMDQIEVREFRCSFPTTDGEGLELSMKLKFHDMRSIKDRREQVMELFYTHKARICDIAFVMKIPKTTVRRWVKYPETRR